MSEDTEDMQIKAETLIILGVEALVILYMSRYKKKYRNPLKIDLQKLICQILPNIEEQYYLDDVENVQPTEEVESICQMVKDTESAMFNDEI